MDFHPLTKFSEIPLVSWKSGEYNKENLHFLEEKDMLLYGVLLLAAAFAAMAGFAGLEMLAVLGICTLPFMQCAIRYLIFKAATSFSGLFAPKQLNLLMGDFSSAVGYLLAMTGSCALMLVISFVCYIRVVL